MIYLDPSGREWKTGRLPPSPHHSAKHIVTLPIFTNCMHPTELCDASTDSIYCTCCICGANLDEGVVALEFNPTQWGVRVACASHQELYEELYVLPAPGILNAFDLLAPTVNQAIEQASCPVCSGPRCKSADCRRAESLVFANRVDQLMSLFYSLRLNVISPLLSYCVTCHELVALQKKVTCKSCGSVFCSKSCKRKKPHACQGLENLWL